VTTITSNYESVKTACARFAKVQEQYSAFGANDTEPRNIFATIVEKLIDEDGDGAVNVPTTADGWELYASSKNCNEAAKALHDAAAEVVQLINNCPTSEMRKVRKYINDYWGW
jgi:hypothetical protein